MAKMVAHTTGQRLPWSALVCGKTYLIDAAELMADGRAISSTPCPGQCGRMVAEVMPHLDAEGEVTSWDATCRCGAEITIFNDGS